MDIYLPQDSLFALKNTSYFEYILSFSGLHMIKLYLDLNANWELHT